MATIVSCYSACGTVWAACYASAGLVAGTITAGVGAPAAALACNAAESTCMMACFGPAAAEGTCYAGPVGGVVAVVLAGVIGWKKFVG